MEAGNNSGNGSSDILTISGAQKISGTVRISGAKNSATRLIAAAMLTDRQVRISNFPSSLEDVKNKLSIMEKLGVTIELGPEEVRIEASRIGNELDDYSTSIRTTYLLAAGQLRHNRIARIPYPSGCAIGERKFDLHIMLWKSMGCVVRERESFIEIESDHLKGSDISFPFPTIGGTENALLCGVLASGRTRVFNAYISPEVFDLIQMLRSMGAKIKVKGNTFIEIDGVELLNGTSYRVIPDRIEAVSWIVAAAVTRGELIIQDVPFSFMEVPMIHFRDIGINSYTSGDALYINHHDFHEHYINPFEVACGVHPGVISDMQPFFTVLATQAEGNSRIIDYRYPERFVYVSEMEKLGGTFDLKKGEVKMRGPIRFKGTEVSAPDLRGGAALMITALIAEGKTTINGYSTIRRGYNNLADKFDSMNIRYSIS
ncbi:MAG: UDP-N-acetylglucosamine 1-carboxyvinyltransferase [Candidatus Krumholzibacteriota bacterium]|nr:UDP-N-acetylglucosamine 1-carboxyvinyltransferase [Candidatus Krumholzibacteriota bacterium]